MLDVVVVSLFDGMSGARIAIGKNPNINLLRYYSSEIDKFAIKVADDNYPEDTPHRLGDVSVIDFNVLGNRIRTQYPTAKILLIGGSPCTNFSVSGNRKGAVTKCGIEITSLNQYLGLKQQGFEFDGQSYLLWEYVRAKSELNPDYFLLENVKVANKWLPTFNTAVGTEPIFINSKLVSAQSRPRYYWTNLPGACVPADKGITLKSILDPHEFNNWIDNNLPPYITRNIPHQHADIQSTENDLFSMDCKSGWADNTVGLRKSPCLRASADTVVVYDGLCYRKLTINEKEKLQTVPVDYTDAVSKAQRYKMLGNGFTVDVIAHLLAGLK